jgi:hypothetical protein
MPKENEGKRVIDCGIADRRKTTEPDLNKAKTKNKE